MAMLPNGNYEEIISPIQHECISKDTVFRCREYGWDIGKLILQVEIDDSYEDGFGAKIEVNFCPFCGYEAKYKDNQTCNFCLNKDSFISKETCCTGCSVLNKNVSK